MVIRIIFSILAIAFGVYILARTEPFVRLIGKSAWAETKLGPGGTYTMWKVAGIIIIIIAGIVLFGIPSNWDRFLGGTAKKTFNINPDENSALPGGR